LLAGLLPDDIGACIWILCIRQLFPCP
jgi:hypothetical protein